MKKFFANNLTLFGEISTIILSFIWYFKSKEIEPLIALIVSTIALLTSIFFKVNSPKLILNIEYSSKGSKQVAPSRSTRNPRDDEGNVILYQGGGTSVYFWHLHWSYTLVIRNNSSQVTYSPILFTKNKSPNVDIKRFLDEFEPIQPQEKIQIQIKYTMSFEGTSEEASDKLKGLGNYPQEMRELEIMISYKDESDSNYFSIFSLNTNKTKISSRKQPNFEKLVLYEVQKIKKN